MTGDRSVRVANTGLRFLPTTRQELVRAMLAESAALEPGPVQRRWLRSACWFVMKEAILVWLRWAAISGSPLLILWILYNGIDSGFHGTLIEIVSWLALTAVLILNIVLLAGRRDR